MSTEYDQIEESNEEIKQSIERITQRAELTQQEKINLQKSLEDEVILLREETENNHNEA